MNDSAPNQDTTTHPSTEETPSKTVDPPSQINTEQLHAQTATLATRDDHSVDTKC